VAVDDAGFVYVADTGNYRIRRIPPSGPTAVIAGDGTKGLIDGIGKNARIGFVQSLAVGPEFVYFGDSSYKRVRRIRKADRRVSTLLHATGYASGGTKPTLGSKIGGLALSPDSDQLAIADTNNHGIRVLRLPVPQYTLNVQLHGSKGYADGPSTTAKFHTPRGLAYDGIGGIWIADSGNHAIRRMAPGGSTQWTVYTVAGGGTSGGAAAAGALDHIGKSAKFNYPYGIAADIGGTMLVADANNHAIRRVFTAGIVMTVAGKLTTSGRVYAAGTAARFNGLRGIAADRHGNVYATVLNSHHVAKVRADLPCSDNNPCTVDGCHATTDRCVSMTYNMLGCTP